MTDLAIRVRIAFMLAFDVVKASTASGFAPAQFDLGAGKELFGKERRDGGASLLRLGFTGDMVVVGGNEGRYKDEEPVINRAIAIRKMLIHDCGIPWGLVRAIPSVSNTGGNIAIVKAQMDSLGIRQEDVAVVSNHYHLPRAALDLAAAGLSGIRTFPAEAFYLLEHPERENELIEQFGGGPLAERMVQEIRGIADKLRGTYKPRTDVQPMSIPAARSPEFR